MRDITVLVTASGAPGTAALLRALRTNGERGVRIVGVDMSPQAVGRQFADRFYVVPPGRDPSFVDAVLDIVRRENIDVVLPQSSFDLLALAESRERFMATTVLVSPPDAIRTANDKAATYALLERLRLRAPAWRKVTGAPALAPAAAGVRSPAPPGRRSSAIRPGRSASSPCSVPARAASVCSMRASTARSSSSRSGRATSQ